MITLRTSLRGNVGEASCIVGQQTFAADGRTIAEAVSNVCKQLAKVKELQGREWSAPEYCLRGIVGETIQKKRRAKSVRDLPGFELSGGKMADDYR